MIAFPAEPFALRDKTLIKTFTCRRRRRRRRDNYLYIYTHTCIRTIYAQSKLVLSYCGSEFTAFSVEIIIIIERSLVIRIALNPTRRLRTETRGNLHIPTAFPHATAAECSVSVSLSLSFV